MHLLCATHALAPLGALSVQILTQVAAASLREAGLPNHYDHNADLDQ